MGGREDAHGTALKVSAIGQTSIKNDINRKFEKFFIYLNMLFIPTKSNVSLRFNFLVIDTY